MTEQHGSGLDPTVAQALVVRKAIQLYRRSGIRVSRHWTNRRMAEAAGRIVGRQLTGRQLPLAEQLLTVWLEGVEHGRPPRPQPRQRAAEAEAVWLAQWPAAQPQEEP